MSNFSTFFPAGGGGEGAGINSYAPFKVAATGNPIGYNATTGLYTNPVDESVWLKTGNTLTETISSGDGSYPNATTISSTTQYFDSKFTGGLLSFSNKGMVDYFPNNALYSIFDNSAGDFTKKNLTTGAVITTYASLGGGRGQWVGYTGTTNNTVITVTSGFLATEYNESTGSQIRTVATGIPGVADGVDTFAIILIGNYLYLTTSKITYEFDATTLLYTGNSFNLPTLAGLTPSLLGQIQMLFDGTYVWMAARNLNTVYRFTSALAYDNFNFSLSDGSSQTTSVFKFLNDPTGTYLMTSDSTNGRQFDQYNKSAVVINVYGDSTTRTSAMGDGQPLFIKLK